ncbi:ubiquitin carboxyl-terminal hydrolase 14 isoform X1 [Protobothrops mucrosquamatus]|uniref:ubiquitin carboxyl-terminal hydrolase 14 isoform X1 n=1 Tax=Protobothrops mucrosquamatus TaxID=103944 RepID=UPI00077584A6|nr:ubiquitin carboxyl-terminal hydrolase 14 isoform X1 [Protobothrops mucrosquamatus]
MPLFTVNVKWGKEKFDGVELNTDEPPMVFKAQLFALTGVQPDRQKVMVKGGTLKDDDWGNIKIKTGMTLLMMGSADALPEEPVARPVFVEDMTEEQLASAMELPCGLTNLGNTCYMNATVQCIRSVPELKEALKRYAGALRASGEMASAQYITAALRDLFDSMDKTSSSIPPIILLQFLHMAFPQFAEKGDQGQYLQQDANECWVQMMRVLQQKLEGIEGDAVMEKETQAILQAIQETSATLTATARKIYEEMKNYIDKMNQKLDNIDSQFKNFKQMVTKNEHRIQKIEDKSTEVDKKLEELKDKNQKLMQINRELKDSIAVMEMEKASYFLRFQNIMEDKEENLVDLITELLADALEIGKQEMEVELDQIYRVNSNYARKNKVPREVHVRFLRKSVRDKILRRVRDDPLKYKGKEIVVLKQIPRRIRESRREYQFLTRKLIEKGVNFRWLIPEGILIYWNMKRYRLDTTLKAMEFYDNHKAFMEEGDFESGTARETKRQEEMVIEGVAKPREEEETKNTNTEEGARPREQRQIRSIRRLRPKYN